jgi:16S rRNA (guanine966-N2)-methyltransferase
MLKIIGGSHKQRILTSPPGSHTRPTAAMVREAVFNICQTAIADARCLDICAGSGAVGLEALSRGAAHAHFVESHSAVLRCIAKNIETLKETEQTTVMRADAVTAVLQLAQQQQLFDIIYIDPPYHQQKRWKDALFPLHTVLLYALDEYRLLTQEGWLFVETAAEPIVWQPLTHLVHIFSRQYGSSQLHLFKSYDSMHFSSQT